VAVVAALAVMSVGGLAGGVVGTPTAEAGAKHYSNCKSMNKVYKHGVKKSKGTKDKVRSHGRTIWRHSSAKVSKPLYNANKKLDRDKDGIACEK
jgi:hypothetical protein